MLKGKGKAAEPRHNPELEESPEGMMDRANALLSQFVAEEERITSSNPNSVQSTITRKLGPLREQLKEDILDVAVACGVTNGKVKMCFHLLCVQSLTYSLVDALSKSRRCQQSMEACR